MTRWGGRLAALALGAALLTAAHAQEPPRAPAMPDMPELPPPTVSLPAAAVAAGADPSPAGLGTPIVPQAAPVARKPHKKKAPDAPPKKDAPPDPNSTRGTTHQDPILLLGLVAAAMYRRYRREDEDEYSYYVQSYEPHARPRAAQNIALPLPPPPPLPQAFRLTTLSWTATVPGAALGRLAMPVPEPAAPATALEVAAPKAEKPKGEERTRVLLIGGGPEWVRFLVDVLRGDGAEVVVCQPGERGVDLLQRARFDAVIVDEEMTGDNAAPAMKRWLARYRPGLEKRLIVSVANLCDAQSLLDETRALTLTRPCSVQDLLVIVRLALQRRSLVVNA